MLSLLLDRLLSKNTRSTVVRLSFFAFQGLLGAILLNDIFRLLYGDFYHKTEVEYGIAGLITIAPFIHDKFMILGHRSNNIMMGLGMAAGTYLANHSESLPKKEIGEKSNI